MSVIFKYRLPLPGQQATHVIPGASTLAHVGLDPSGDACVWLLIAEGPDEARTFSVVGTGHTFPPPWQPIGSFIDGPFVWHAVEVLTP